MNEPAFSRLGQTLAVSLLAVLAGCAESGDDSGSPGPSRPVQPDAARSTSPPDAAMHQPASVEAAPARLSGESAPTEPAPHLRVVWTRDMGDATDLVSLDDQMMLMAYDSEDGRGERPLLPETASYAKPLIAPDGGSVVFTVRHQSAVYAIGWDGSGLRQVTDGFALDVWADPADGAIWVYVGGDEMPTDPPSYPVVRRYLLNDPTVSEVVWNAQPVTADSFQLAADGRTASGLFPWPNAGVADLSSGTWRKLGEGCWTAFSPGADPLFWYFDGSHRNVTIVNLDTDERWGVPVNDHAVFGGYEVYHPRWTNDPRGIVLTGPYNVGQRANKVWAGGNQVEVHVGFFDETFTSIASWWHVTHNDFADFYPDAWIEPGTGPAPRARRTARPAGRGETAAGARDAAAGDSRDASPLVVELRVRQQAAPPAPESIAPYREGLLALEYDVVRVVEGELGPPVVAVAHWVIRDARLVTGAAREAGALLRLAIEPYDARPELEGKRLVFETTDLALPLFYDVASADLAPPETGP